MADLTDRSRPGFRDVYVRFVDMGDGTFAEKIVVVNPNGTPIAGGGGGGGGGIVQQGARDVSVQPWQVETYVGAVAIDPRSIRTLTSADVVDVSDRAGRALGVVASITAVVHVDDNAGSLTIDNANLDVALSTRLKPADTLAAVTTVATVTSLTQMNGQAIAMGTGVRTAGTQRVTIATDDSVPVTGAFFQATQPVSIAAAVDVSDRAARLVGVVYGSQSQQLKQTATNFNQQVESFVAGTAIDPRSIRTLTTADAVNVGQWIGSAAPTVGQKTMANSLPVVLASDQSVLPASSEQRAATLHVTATAAVNTASTATLPAAGAGLFHYITHIELVKLYSVIGVAAGAGVIVTSTNLPGNPSWTTEQLASPAGTATKVIVYSPATPLKSSVANTATTFVAPLQLQTIWRWNISYFTAV